MYRITAIVWHSHTTTLRKAAAQVRDRLNVKVYSARNLQEGKEDLDAARADLARAELIFLYRSTGETIWNELEGTVRELDRPVVCLAYDPALWVLSTVPAEVVARCHTYIVQGGEENFTRMLRYVAAVVLAAPLEVEEPLVYPWEGIYHPGAPAHFAGVEDYLAWYRRPVPMLGLLFARNQWVNRTLAVEDALIGALEARRLGVIPTFCYSLKDEGLGTKGSGEVVREFFLGPDGRPRIAGLIKLLSFFLSARTGTDDFLREGVAASGVELLKQLGVPVFQPVISFYKTIEEWVVDPQGLSQEVSWSVALPEFEGVIEPVFLGAARREGELEVRQPVLERVERIADRVAKWVGLRQKPVAERRVAFILHNNPCAAVEATVGGGAHLDTLESVARILKRMPEAGYAVEVPASGKELIETVMERKAVSEFRWTTADEIVSKGGALKLMSVEEYSAWFDGLPARVRQRLIEAWGKPPGEAQKGVPAAMVYEGRIIITGVRYRNAVVCVQPKRGCAGARCDGQVCKILHDPDIPPPHQYLATYRWLEREFGVDVLVHVGTHGNLEFLPGKGVGLSGECYPDLAIGAIPHLYIYNADNPPEGTIAKRRSYATLVDHMQTVLVQGGLYDELAELDRYLDEYERARVADPVRTHTLEHLIMDEIKKTNLEQQISVQGGHASFSAIARQAHAALSIIRNTYIQDGQHIFGEVPQGERRVDFLNAILRYDAGEATSPRKAVARLMGLELGELLADQDRVSLKHGKSYGALLAEIDTAAKAFIALLLKGRPVTAAEAAAVLGESPAVPEALENLNSLLPRVLDLNERVEASREIEALLDGFAGRYIPAGPSGLITRGRDDVLPTGRNFYSLDPHRVPTRAAWEVGKRLAEKVLAKHLTEEGHYPENIAIYWMCSDIMWADGEGLGQMLYLLGCRPQWLPNGRVGSIEIIPLEELNRPRIDLTVRVSGIIRDNFPNRIDFLDEAIQTVARLDEPPAQNFIRKHTLAQLDGAAADAGAEAWRDATLRIFASRPGTYMAGVNLAVYASAWKEEKDLADIFVYWNGYAYGQGVFGKEAFGQLQSNLETVDLTYNKVVSDEYDLCGCCGYFGAHGGMTAAARAASGKEVRTYYGDTREPEHVEVRTLADEIRRVVRTKLLNPKWIEGQKRHGYKGAGDISKRIGRVYGWEASTREVDDWIFDDITKTFVLDKENRRFFEEHNPWALEEIARRLLEAANRGLWEADPEMLTGLKEHYLEIEGWLEEKMGEIKGDFQGGAIDVLTAEEVGDWGKKMAEIKEKLRSGRQN